MSKPSLPVSLEEISQRIRQAAVSLSWRPGHHLSSSPASIPETGAFHAGRIQASLLRARQKTFVKAVKPLRRIVRNQGAVNDSLIEAVHHLAAQNQEMSEDIQTLRDLVGQLRAQLRPDSRRIKAADGSAVADRGDKNDSCA